MAKLKLPEIPDFPILDGDPLGEAPGRKRPFPAPVYAAIVALNLLLLIASWTYGPVRDGLGLHASAVWHGQAWRVLTHAWVHAGWGHFIGNMLLLLPFGIYLEWRFGSLRFAAAYLLSCLAVGIALTILGQNAIGASGAVCAMVLLAVLSMLSREGHSPWTFPLHLALGIAIAIVLVLPLIKGDLLGLFRKDGISHWGHFAGFGFGFVLFRLRLMTRALSFRLPRRARSEPTPT